MDYYPRVPSRIVGLNDAVSGNRQDSESVHLKMLPPPALIHSVPSYVSNRSISNRSVSNHSVSHRSVGTSATKGRRPQNAATREAELIAVANTQARAAAQSILLAGGSQAAALSTAKAAAKSVLQPAKEDSDGKPPLGSTRNNHFRNRRKNKQQAEIIASMALVSANEALEYGYMGQDAMTMTPGGLRSAYQDERDSEFPDDYTNFRSLGPSVYGRSHSVRSQHEMQLSRFPEYYEQARLDKQNIQPLKALEQEIKVVGPSAGLLQEQSYADHQSTLNSRGIDAKTSLLLTKVPSVKALFQGIQGPSNVEKVSPSEAAEKAQRIKIPTELPRSNSIKAFAPLKPNGSGKPPVKNDQTNTPRSRQQLSESQISCYSDRSSVSHTNSYSYAGSTYDEHTADYTRGTFESAVDSTTRRKSYLNRRGGASFFSTMDPFVRTFSEVFSCAPPVPLKRTPDDSQSVTNSRFQMHESRDMATTTEYNGSINKIERRDQPPPVGPVINTAIAAPRRSTSVVIAAPRRSTSVDDSILSTNDIHLLVDQTAETTHKDLSKNKNKVKSPTMEQLVLRALSAISPKGAASRRPRLNVRPLKQNARPDTMTKYRSFEGDNDKAPAKSSAQNVRGGKETGMLKNQARSSTKPRKDESVSHNSDAIASLGKNSSSNQESQQHPQQQQQSSGSSEYYMSASTDDSANVMAAIEPTPSLPQGPALMYQKSTVSQKNKNVESKTKRFPSMTFHRSRRHTRTTAGE